MVKIRLMKYPGGKARLAKQIIQTIKTHSCNASVPVIEPFCGGCWLTAELGRQKYMDVTASDANESLVLMWQAAQDGCDFPDEVTEEEYKKYRDERVTSPPSAMKAFVGIASSYSGKWYGGYARDRVGGRNFVREAKDAINKKLPYLSNTKFVFSSYDAYVNVTGSIFICDPPYSNTTDGYFGDPFDSNKFWGWARETSKTNRVYITEYSAPEDFESIMSKTQGTSLNNASREKQSRRTEQLFVLKT